MYEAEKLWFIGIGIGVYSHYENLPNAANDVKAISILLKDRFETDQTELLLDERATGAALTELLEDLPERVGSNDSLILYYAGHGKPGRNDNSYWLPTDATSTNRLTQFRTGTVRDMLADVDVKHLLVLCDSCFGGGLVQGGRYRSVLSNENRAANKRKSRWIICSGSSTQFVMDGKDGTHSPFAQGILDILSDPEIDEIRVSSLADRLRGMVGRYYHQDIIAAPMPRLGDENGMFVFRHLSKDEKAWKKAKRLNSLTAYQSYLDIFPSGKYALVAKRKTSPPTLPKKRVDKINATYTFIHFLENDWCFFSQDELTYDQAITSVPSELKLPASGNVSVLAKKYNDMGDMEINSKLDLKYKGYHDEYDQLIGKGNLTAFWLLDSPGKRTAYAFFMNQSLRKAYLRPVNKKARLRTIYLKK